MGWVKTPSKMWELGIFMVNRLLHLLIVLSNNEKLVEDTCCETANEKFSAKAK